MAVAQYEVAFTKLAKYAPDMVNTEAKRKRWFWLGLNVQIQNALVTARIDTYVDMDEYAQRVEDSQARLKEFRNFIRADSKYLGNLKKKVPQGQARLRHIGFRGHSRKRPNEASPFMPDKRKKPQVRCRHCRLTNHTENECWKKMGKCLKCESLKHPTEECPIMKGKP